MISPDNRASLRLVERLGFRREGGPLRDYWRVGEHYTSALVYGLIDSDRKSEGTRAPPVRHKK